MTYSIYRNEYEWKTGTGLPPSDLPKPDSKNPKDDGKKTLASKFDY